MTDHGIKACSCVHRSDSTWIWSTNLLTVTLLFGSCWSWSWLGQRGIDLVASEIGLKNQKQVLNRIIKGKRRCKIVADCQENDRHYHQDSLLRRIAGLRGNSQLPKLGRRHNQRQDVDRKSGQLGNAIRLG